MFSRQPLVVGFYFIYMIDWGKLSASEKAEWMRICISNGVRDLGAIRELYDNNEFRGGGETETVYGGELEPAIITASPSTLKGRYKKEKREYKEARREVRDLRKKIEEESKKGNLLTEEQIIPYYTDIWALPSMIREKKEADRAKDEWLSQIGGQNSLVSQLYRFYSRHFGYQKKHPNELVNSGRPADIIDLSKNVIRLTPDSEQSTALFNEFVESKNPSVLSAQEYKENPNRIIGDKYHFPASNVSIYGGVEDGKFKLDSLENFKGETTVIPARNIKAGTPKISQIVIDGNNDNDNNENTIVYDNAKAQLSHFLIQQSVLNDEINLKQNLNSQIIREDAKMAADSIANRLASQKLSFYDKIGEKSLKKDLLKVSKGKSPGDFSRAGYELTRRGTLNPIKPKYIPIGGPSRSQGNNSNKYHFYDELGNSHYISEYNAGILDGKTILANPNGGVFIGRIQDITKPQLDSLNAYLKENPSWLMRPDLGSFDQYRLDNPSLSTYLKQYFEHPSANDPNVYTIGTTEPNKLWSEFKDGGGIHIKPSHRGRFTALQERTGKSASWYKAHGTPAQRKMATFALNARKWHHGEGGYLEEEDEEYFGGTLPAATVSTTLPSIQSKQGQAIAKNMAERVASGQMNLGEVPRRYYNYVQGEAKGAIPMRGYMDKATNVALGTLAVPLATMAAAEAAPVLAPGSALWSNPIVQQAVASELGGRAVDLVSKDFTGKTWAENMSGAFDKVTGLNSSDTFVGQMASEMTNPGYLLSPSHFITKVGINRLPQAAFDNYANRVVKEGFTPSPRVAAEEPKLQQFPEVVKTAPKQELPPYEIEDLGGGYMLKSLMRGNPLEKQLSKQGTVNVNNVKALINKGSDIEKTIVDKVLSGDEFANKKSIDYNKFRKAVQDELIAYDRTPNKTYKDYGLNRLYEDPAGSSAGWYSFLEPETFTFSSSRIPNGSSKHYDANTLGHSRTYTTAKEPDVLHVMESQSDWAQSGVAKEIKGDLAQSNDLIETYQWRIDQLEKETSTGVDQWGFPISEESMSDKRKILDDVKSWLEKELERNKELASTNSAQAKYLSDNYTTKQIQENLKYAAEQGQTKMRYPTRETAAKIEGYPEREAIFDSNGNDVTARGGYTTFGEEKDARLKEIEKELRRIENFRENGYSQIKPEYRDEWLAKDNTLYDELRNEKFEISKSGGELKPGYTSKVIYDYEDILKKYSEFPKQYKKLYKDADVRTVTDSKGNTWYEVDVPTNYLDQEWQYSRVGNAINKLKDLPGMLADSMNKEGMVNVNQYPEVKNFLQDVYLPILKQEGNRFNMEDTAKSILQDSFIDMVPIELKNRISKFLKGTAGVAKDSEGFGHIELGMAKNEKERLKDIIHELDHTYRRNLGKTSDMNYGLLYNGNERGIPSKIAKDMNNRFSVFKEGFQNKFGGTDMNQELTATSSEIKMDLYLDYFDKNGKYPNAEQIKSYIDHLSDEEINNLFKTTNAYGKNIINQIDKFNSTNKESANQNLRWLLKNVAIMGVPFGIGAEMLSNQSWDFSK